VKTLLAIIEDDKANVIGASTEQGDVMLPAGESFPRSELRAKAVALATQFGITIPPEIAAALQADPPPAP
jgi:hypothetical protein